MFGINGDFFIYFILSSPASSFVSSIVSSLVTTTAATLVLVAAVVAVLAIVVVVVEIRVETLFLLVLEEAGTLVFLIPQLGSGRCYSITDVGIGVVAPALRRVVASALRSMIAS